MRKLWGDEAWQEYLNWQTQDKKMLKKINRLLMDIDRNGYQCIGKPEPLSGNLQGYWSVRIDEKNILIAVDILSPISSNVFSALCFISSSTRKLICAIIFTPFCIIIIIFSAILCKHLYIHLLLFF